MVGDGSSFTNILLKFSNIHITAISFRALAYSEPVRGYNMLKGQSKKTTTGKSLIIFLNIYVKKTETVPIRLLVFCFMDIWKTTTFALILIPTATPKNQGATNTQNTLVLYPNMPQNKMTVLEI